MAQRESITSHDAGDVPELLEEEEGGGGKKKRRRRGRGGGEEEEEEVKGGGGALSRRHVHHFRSVTTHSGDGWVDGGWDEGRDGGTAASPVAPHQPPDA